MSPARLLDRHRRKEWLAWLSARTDRDLGSGFDATGWAASTWVLHSMYEDPSLGYEASHDDLYRQRLAAGLEKLSPIAALLADSGAVVEGGVLGMAGPVGVDCVRLTWRALAERLGLELGHSDVPPCYRWFPYRSWPAGIYPPDEGSLDSESLVRLVSHLSQLSGEGAAAPCIAYYTPLVTGDWDEPWVSAFLLGEVADLIEPDTGRVGSPSNWWPVDKTWMVYTDWDLWATRVSGPRQLIDDIISDDQLETIDWPLTH